MSERSRTIELSVVLCALALLGCLCAPIPVGDTCSASAPCVTGVCDPGIDGGYCTMPCNVPLGDYCKFSGDQAYGICGLILSDAGLGCAQECPLDGGGGLGSPRPCRPGFRCVPPSPCSAMPYFGCPRGGICVP